MLNSTARPAHADRAPLRPARLRPVWLAIGLVVVLAAVVVGVSAGPVTLPPRAVALQLADLLPGISFHSGLSARERALLLELRLPRVVLALLVGGLLALAGAAYQGVFRNPLADPHLLGVAAGAGLGVTAVITTRHGTGAEAIPLATPLAAFAGAIAAVVLTYALASRGGDRSPSVLILAGVAVSAFLAAAQTFLMQRDIDAIREVYSWLLGRLGTAGWRDVTLVLPYAVVTLVVVLAHRRSLDVLSVGDAEAAGLGLDPRRTRLVLVAAASLGTAAAVSVSGLIGFVGIIVPHTVRLLAGVGYRTILPVSALVGGAFLILADLVARTAAAPAEIPIGVITAFVGAPFFVLVLRTNRGRRL